MSNQKFFSLTLNLNQSFRDIGYLLPFLIGSTILPFIVIDIFNHPYMWGKTYSVFIAASLGLGILIFTPLQSYLIKLTARTRYLLWGLLGTLIFNYFFHEVNPFYVETFQRIVFWALVFFFVAFLKIINEGESYLIFIPLFVGLTVFIFIDLLLYVIFAEHLPYLTFGNQNISAEYVGFCFALMMGVRRKFEQQGYGKILDFLIPFSGTYILYTNCRSAYIGAILVVFYMLVMRELNLKKFFRLFTIFFIFSLLLYIVFISFHDPKLLGTVLNKTTSTSGRWIIFLDSLNMLLDKPFGSGLGSYEFSSIPYLTNLFPNLNEGMIFKSPHVEFLRFLIEDGIVAAGLMAAVILFYLYDVRKLLPQTLRTHPEIVAYFIFFSVHFAVQFPLDNPFPFFMTAFMVAYFITSLNVDVIPLRSSIVKTVLPLLFVILCVGTLTQIFSRYIDHTYPSHRKLNALACHLDPSNWSACLNVVSIDLSQGNLKEAEKGAKAELLRRPNNYHAMRYLAYAYLDQNDKKNACNLLEKYDDFFANHSSLNGLKLEKCLNYGRK